METLWVEKYRPKEIDDYVFVDKSQKKLVETWIKDKSIPHILLGGHAGIGKTTLARLLIEKLDTHPADVLDINASNVNGIEDVRTTIINFVQMIPFGDFKIVLFDEADYLSHSAQATLRSIFEEYHEFARFILTCNDLYKVMPALQSRCHTIDIQKTDKTEFTARVATVLMREGITPDLDVLDTYVRLSFPDLRKCLNTVQQNIEDNSLVPLDDSSAYVQDWKLIALDLFRENKILEGRKTLCKNMRKEEMHQFYGFLFENIEIFGDEEQQFKAIHLLRKATIDHTICIDPEINLASCLIQLSEL